MRKILFLLWGVLNVIFFTSCDQNDKEDFSDKDEHTLAFKYEGKNYISGYQVIKGKVICENEQVQQIYDKLADNANLATLLNEDGSLEYFDSYNNLIEYLDRITPATKEAVTRAGINCRSTIGLYADPNYRGESKIFTFDVPGQQTGAAYADLSTIGMLNKISSVKVGTDYFTPAGFNSRITLYDQRNFTGYSITWQTVRNTNNPINVPNLTNIHRGPLVTTTTWNDAAQSARIGFITNL